MYSRIVIALLLTVFFSQPLAAAQSDETAAVVNVELIIDASGSMATPTTTGETRMEAAQAVLDSVVDGLPDREGLNVGLRVYGHEGDNSDAMRALSCESSELFVPIDGVEKEELQAEIDALEPVGWTPLGESLERAGNDFPRADDETINVIVLLTDGLETCDGNPVAAAAALRSGNAAITTNVVGLGTTPEEQAVLEGIADAGGGTLFGAQNADELSDAIFSLLAEDIPDIATPVPTEEPVAADADAGTRDNPVPFSASSEIGDFSIRVVDVIPDATDLVLTENPFNEPPADGRQFFIATVEATYNGGATGHPGIDLNYSAVGESAVAYVTFTDTCGVVPDDLYQVTELFEGGTTQFNVCWSVESSDADSLVMYVEDFIDFNAEPVFFSLDAS